MTNNIKNWNTDPNKNDAESPYGWKEDMAPSDVNNTARQEMADIKDAYVNQPWFSVGNPVYGGYDISLHAYYVTIDDDETDTDYSKYFTEGRRLRWHQNFNEGVLDTYWVYGVVLSSQYSAESHQTTVYISCDSQTYLQRSTDLMLGLELKDFATSAGPNLLGCILPFTADDDDLGFGLGLADGTTFNPDLYQDLAELYTLSGTAGGTYTTYKYGEEYNSSAGKNWPKKPDVRGLYPKFSNSTSSTGTVYHTFSENHAGSRSIKAYKPLTKTSDQIQNITGEIWTQTDKLGGAFTIADSKMFSSNRGAANDAKHVKFDASRVARTGSETEVASFNTPAVLVMYGGYGKAGLIKPEALMTLLETNLKDYIDNNLPSPERATTTTYGTVILATDEEAIDETDTESAMTPATTVTAINHFLPATSTITDISSDITALQNTKASTESVTQLNTELDSAVAEINELIVEMDDRYTKAEVNALIGGATATTTASVTITPESWDASTLSVAIYDYQDANDVFWVSPAGTKENITAYSEAGCFAARDATTAKLVLYCDTIPTGSITVELVHMDIA